MTKTCKHHGAIVHSLLESLTSRFSGLLKTLHLVPGVDDTGPFGEMVYKMACVLDPTYSFQWLLHDHAGPSDVKQNIKDVIIECIRLCI